MALSEYDKQHLTSAQQQKIEAATQAYERAQAAGDRAGMDAAHAQAEAVRAQAGYSGGTEGDDYAATGSADASVKAHNDYSAQKGSTSATGYAYEGYTGVSSAHDQATLSGADLAALEKLSAQAKYYTAAGDKDAAQALHRQAQEIRAKYQYVSAEEDGTGVSAVKVPEQPKVESAAEKYDKQALLDYLDRWLEAAVAQSAAQRDYTTAQGLRELDEERRRAEAQYQTQRNQISIDEARAKDDHALYTAAKGERGGIGAAQYDSIMNTAAQNRLAVSQAQTKLANDTAREMAQLRAQGAYGKADDLLELNQTYFAKLISLEQWAAEYDLSVEHFNRKLQQWQAEYDLELQKLYDDTRRWQTELDWETQQEESRQSETYRKNLAAAGQSLLEMGVLPSAGQLSAMGMSEEQAKAYLAQTREEKEESSSLPNGGGEFALYLDAMESDGTARTYIKTHYKEYGLSVVPTDSSYQEWQEGLKEQMDVNGFSTFLAKLRYTLSEEGAAHAKTLTDPYWPTMSQTQRLRTREVYELYGKTYRYGT